MSDILIKNIVINIFYVSGAVEDKEPPPDPLIVHHLYSWQTPPTFLSLKHSFMHICLVCYMIIGDATLSS